MRLSTAFKRFDTQLRAGGKSEHTRGAYLGDLGTFEGWLGADPNVATINSNKLSRYFAREGSTGKPAISPNRTETALRMFFKFLTGIHLPPNHDDDDDDVFVSISSSYRFLHRHHQPLIRGLRRR
jgi:site-specific recombinase XerD